MLTYILSYRINPYHIGTVVEFITVLTILIVVISAILTDIPVFRFDIVTLSSVILTTAVTVFYAITTVVRSIDFYGIILVNTATTMLTDIIIRGTAIDIFGGTMCKN